jgi:hypothetical protein
MTQTVSNISAKSTSGLVKAALTALTRCRIPIAPPANSSWVACRRFCVRRSPRAAVMSREDAS